MCHIPRAIDPLTAIPRPLPLKDRLALSMDLTTLTNPVVRGDVVHAVWLEFVPILQASDKSTEYVDDRAHGAKPYHLLAA